MPKSHFKSAPLFLSVKKNVDKRKGVIRNIVIVQEGIDKDFGYFDRTFLKDLTNAGNNQKQGVKARFGHPNMCKSAMGSYIGRYKNFRLKGNKVLADLWLDPITKKTQVEGQGITMFDYVVEMSETNPDMFGNSIHFFGPVEYVEKEFDGKTVTVEKYSLHSFYASDLVDMPAATENLFKDVDDLGLLVSRFLDENPEIFKAVQKDESVILKFLKRYDNYLNLSKTKTDPKMKILKRLQKRLGLTKDIDVTLANGEIATVVTEAENVEVGDAINDSEGNPLEDGTYALPDGYIFEVEGGVITNIIEPDGDETDEVSEDDLEEVTEATTKALLKGVNSVIKNVNTLRQDISEAIGVLGDKVAETEKNHKILAKSVKSTTKSYSAQRPSGKQKSTTSYDPAKAKEARAKLKKQAK